MTTGVFPASLKTADITPLMKKTLLDQDVLKTMSCLQFSIYWKAY